MARGKLGDLGIINWTANDNKLIWDLPKGLAKKENHGALYGIQKGNKTLGVSKTKIHKDIAGVIFSDIYVEGPFDWSY